MSVASIAAVVATGLALAEAAKRAIDLGKDVAPLLRDLKRVFSGERISVEELAEMRARNDALNSELERQTESGGG